MREGQKNSKGTNRQRGNFDRILDEGTRQGKERVSRIVRGEEHNRRNGLHNRSRIEKSRSHQVGSRAKKKKQQD
jgi:hypothetical protein